MSNDMESLQIQLDVTQQLAAQANLMLDRVLARGGDRDMACLETGSQFSNISVFDSK